MKRGKQIGIATIVTLATVLFAATEAMARDYGASLSAAPTNYSGTCPAKITFTGKITAKKAGKVQYKFIRSDGAFAPIQSLEFNAPGAKEVETTWTLGGPSLPSYSGWQAIELVYPTSFTSNKAHFKVRCAGANGGQGSGKPDLMVKINGPSSAAPGEDIGNAVKLTARNAGAAAAPGTVGTLNPSDGFMIDVVLSKDASVPSGFATYSDNFHEDVLLKGGRVSRTDDLGAGASKGYPVGATIPADTPPGKYRLCAQIDPANKVAESNEGNNVACDRITVKAGGQGGPTGRQPDLIVPSVRFRKVESRTDARGGQYWIFNVIVSVKNQGGAAAGPFKVLLERNVGPGGSYTKACLTCVIDVPGLAAGATTTLPPRQFNNANNMNSIFRATADSTNAVAESNEGNNMNAETFTP